MRSVAEEIFLMVLLMVLLIVSMISIASVLMVERVGGGGKHAWARSSSSSS